MADNIHQAIHEVMKEVGYVQKGSSPNLRYTFAGEADLIAALRPSMVAHGILVYPLKYENLVIERYTTDKGSSMINARLVATFRFVHAPSETFVDVQSCGEGADSGDKSINKAMTDAYKYALRQTFEIETGDDPDKYPSEDSQAASEKASGRKVSKEDGGNGYERSEKGLAQLAKGLGLSSDQAKTALKEAGFSKFSVNDWEKMREALGKAAIDAKAHAG